MAPRHTTAYGVEFIEGHKKNWPKTDPLQEVRRVADLGIVATPALLNMKRVEIGVRIGS
jgi:hypothetical protein